MTETFIPPNNCEIESALLGAILTNNRALDRVTDILKAEHFYEPVHGRIYGACVALVDRGETASPITLKHYFEDDKALESVGGSQYLFDIAASVITVINAADYGRTIHDLYLRRRLIQHGQDVIERAQYLDVEESAQDVLVDAETDLFEIANQGRVSGPVPASEAAWRTLEQIEAAMRAKQQGQVVGLPTGLAPLDEMIGGLHDSALVVLAGATSQGKSALAGTIADSITAAGRHVLFASLEMPEEQVMKRAYCRLTGVPVRDMDRANISHEDLKSLADAAVQIGHWPLNVLDKGDLGLTELRSHARRLAMAGKLSLIVVDYLQLLAPPQTHRPEGRVQEVSKISRGLKALAMDLKCPVLALSQLSREVDKRDDKRPQLSDLRESGTIEQDADVVLFVYREEKYLLAAKPGPDAKDEVRANYESRLDRVRGTAEIIVAKQRHGPLGECIVGFDGRRMLFTSERSVVPSTADEIERQHVMEGLL